MLDAPPDISTLEFADEARADLLDQVIRARVTEEEMDLFKRLGGARWLRRRVEITLIEMCDAPIVTIPRTRDQILTKAKTLRARVTSKMHADILMLGGSGWIRRELQRAKASC